MRIMKRFLFSATAIALLLILMFSGSSLHFLPKNEVNKGNIDAPQPENETNLAEQGEPGSEKETSEAPEALESQFYEISFIGDITPDSVQFYRNTPQGYQNVVTPDNLGYVFANTKHLFENDYLTIGNFECVLSDRNLASKSKNFVFKAPTVYTGIMTEGSVEFVTLGNNHVLDYGEEGYADTKAALDAAGIAYAGRDEYTIYERDDGLKVGIYADSFSSIEKIQKGIAALKNEGAEFIIAALHWGDEGAYKVNSTQQAQGHAAIDAGADIVYGTHPHTLQPIEVYKDKYIFYSCGNWTFGGNTDPRDKDTVVIKLNVEKKPNGEVVMGKLTLLPCASSGVLKGNNYQPVLIEESDERYKRVLSKLDGSFEGANLEIGYTYGVGELG